MKSPAGTLTFDRNTMCGMQLFCYLLVVIFLPVIVTRKKLFWDGKLCLSLDNISICTTLVDNCKFDAQTRNSRIKKHSKSFVYIFIYIGAPARTVGWRDPGFIHTSFLKELWPNKEYVVSQMSVILHA